MFANNLNVIPKKIILGLEDIEFRVIAVVTDNNWINCKSLFYFVSLPKLSIVYPHLYNQNRLLLIIFFDTIHILKGIQNT